MGAAQHVCPGYTQLANGLRVYHNANPGVVITCAADGTLVATGEPNFELKAGDAPPEPKPAGDGEGAKDEGYVLGLLVTIFLLVLCVAALLTLNFGAVVTYLVRRRADSRTPRLPVE
jgi:hypothetical protein